MHFFSIITITLNDVGGLCATRSSIEEQTLKDFEWIVIDGASTDGTVEELSSCRMPNLSYVSEKDKGLYDAMNKGLTRCRGQYVIFMNSADSFTRPDVLASVKKRILDSGGSPGIVFGDAFERTAEGRLLLKKARRIEWLNYGMHTHHQAIFYSRESLENVRFDESFKVAADYDLTCRVYRGGQGSLELGFPVCVFSRGGLSEKKSHIGRNENWRIQRDVLGHSLRRRLMTRSAYFVSFVARNGMRSIYDRLRFQHNHGSS
jgi:putative colanic acid biosynthesis glycosyltransferase